MKIAALIVAGGRGTRVGGDLPKQYRVLAGKSVLKRSVEALLPHVDCVQTVIHCDDEAMYNAAIHGLNILPVCFGADERQGSVLAGLMALEAEAPDLVLIHDAARPFVSDAVISSVIKKLSDNTGAFPALPVSDALWKDGPIPRDGLWRAQTPQGFRFTDIISAHKGHSGAALDDASVAHAAGIEVAIVAGDEANFKITTASDFVRAETMLGDIMDIRTGNGFDVHRVGAGEFVTLCGIKIPHDGALIGHSDADVAMHAITDAIFGALAEGDIGQWFPPSDPQWKGAASDIFLTKAVDRADERVFSITHIDCTIICEMPKIGPHAIAMRQRIADITKIEIERVSVKATTSETLGFTGRGEGIAASATATLVKI